jgi:hypothetical protein
MHSSEENLPLGNSDFSCVSSKPIRKSEEHRRRKPFTYPNVGSSSTVFDSVSKTVSAKSANCAKGRAFAEACCHLHEQKSESF